MTMTNDERREVAERLRGVEFHTKLVGVELAKWYEALCTAVGGERDPWMGIKALCDRLADLIEPEPERTCRVVTDKNTVSQTQEVHTKHCSECSYVFGREQHRQLLPGLDEEFVLHAVQIPDYCPNCGAKVVAE